jgi:hypothetical protein
MKNIIAILLLAALNAVAQSYTLSTNLTSTNTVYSGQTLTYLGTNQFDVTRYRQLFIAATGSGTNISTNTISFLFLAGPDGTNWEAAPRYCLTLTANGTNPFTIITNLDCTGVGYLKPYQIINSTTNAVTNIWIYGGTKTYPRN